MKSKIFVTCLAVSALFLIAVSAGSAMALNSKSPVPPSMQKKPLTSLTQQAPVKKPIVKKRVVDTKMEVLSNLQSPAFMDAVAGPGDVVYFEAFLTIPDGNTEYYSDGTPLVSMEVGITVGAGTIQEVGMNFDPIGPAGMKQIITETNAFGSVRIKYTAPDLDCGGAERCEISDLVAAMFYGAETDCCRYQYSAGYANIIVTNEPQP